MEARPVKKTNILEQTLCKHLGADIDPAAHHTSAWGVNLKREGVQHDLSEVIIVAISIYKLLQIVKDFELAQQLVDALIRA